MNDPQWEAGVLAEQLQKSFKGKSRAKLEIRAVAGTEGRATADRLLASLRLGGLDAEIVEVPMSPREEILVECSHDTAGTALSLQSAFLAAGTPVQLLVHNKAKPRTIVLHLGSS
jgi:hypothetical protein